MQLTSSFVVLLQHFAPVFTEPTFRTFVQVVTGWVLSHRHRYITDIIFSGGNLGDGHWCRFHRFFSLAAWDIDVLSMYLAKLVATLIAPGATQLWAVDDTLCRKRGLTLYGAGMHHDPLLSSKKMKLVSWGHVWVVVTLVISLPAWAPSKIFSLPIGFRLYRNRQGNNKGKKNKEQDTRSRCPRKRKKKQKKTKNTRKKSQPVVATEIHQHPDDCWNGILNLPCRFSTERGALLVQDVHI